MSKQRFERRLGRRSVLELVAAAAGTAATFAMPLRVRADADDVPPYRLRYVPRAVRWEDHFATLDGGAILADTRGRVVHFWADRGAIYRLYPCSVPLAAEFRRRGVTEVVRKVEGPEWRATPSMRGAQPDLPGLIHAGPGNPFGAYALYLGWKHYRIHGIDDGRKIGRPVLEGCIGMHDDHIAQIFPLVGPGTKVRII